jgi:hypothetical protein
MSMGCVRGERDTVFRRMGKFCRRVSESAEGLPSQKPLSYSSWAKSRNYMLTSLPERRTGAEAGAF